MLLFYTGSDMLEIFPHMHDEIYKAQFEDEVRFAPQNSGPHAIYLGPEDDTGHKLLSVVPYYDLSTGVAEYNIAKGEAVSIISRNYHGKKKIIIRHLSEPRTLRDQVLWALKSNNTDDHIFYPNEKEIYEKARYALEPIGSNLYRAEATIGYLHMNYVAYRSSDCRAYQYHNVILSDVYWPTTQQALDTLNEAMDMKTRYPKVDCDRAKHIISLCRDTIVRGFRNLGSENLEGVVG